MELSVHNTREIKIDSLSYDKVRIICEDYDLHLNDSKMFSDPSGTFLSIFPRGFIPEGWVIVGTYNRNEVISTRSSDGQQCGALKISNSESSIGFRDLKKECRQTRLFYKLGIGSKVKGYCSFYIGDMKNIRLSAFHVEDILCTLSWYFYNQSVSGIHILVEKIFEFIHIMKNGRYTNTKFRMDNIGISITDNGSTRLTLIDVRDTFSYTSLEEDILKLIIHSRDGFMKYRPTHKRLAKSFVTMEEFVRKKAYEVYGLKFPENFSQLLGYDLSNCGYYYSRERYCSAVTIQKTFRGFQGKKLSDDQRCIPDNLFGDFSSFRAKKLRIDLTNFN